MLAGPDGYVLPAYANDELHRSPAGYAALNVALTPLLTKALQRVGSEVGEGEGTGARGGSNVGQQKRNRAQEQRQAFRDRVKALRCPHCEVEFSDAALDWAEAWLEGRFDLMQEAGWQERDGPYKLRCELCGQRSWLDYFAWTVKSAEKT